MQKLSNYINHYIVVLDESYSMWILKSKVIQVFDGLVAHLATTSQDLLQETRISVYAFNSRGTARCLVWDIDVLRMPSIEGMYQPNGRTALIDCTLLAIEDNKTVPQKYGDHSFVVYVITDGQENDSVRRFGLKDVVSNLPDNWTFGVFVPDQRGVQDAITYGGFSKDSIKIWDTSASGLEAVGKVMQTTSTQLMKQRTQGVRGTTSLFKMNTVSTSQIKANLKPLSAYDYHLGNVLYDCRSDQYMMDRLGRPWVKGQVFYQLTKKEKIQSYKQLALVTHNGTVYSGDKARTMLGLPANEDVEVIPDNWTQHKIFVQSTAPNRKLLAGTQVIVMNNNNFTMSGDPWQK